MSHYITPLRQPLCIQCFPQDHDDDDDDDHDDGHDDDDDDDGENIVAGTPFLTRISIPAHNESNPTQAHADSAQLLRLF